MPFFEKIVFLSDANEPKQFPIPKEVFLLRAASAPAGNLQGKLAFWRCDR